jgi:histidyl-tRNA synthetase
MSDAKKIDKILAVKGMNDILPPAAAHWEWLEAQVRAVMASFAYRNTRLPIVEPTALFVRGIGEATDIVEKEMYSFEDKLNGDQLTLRPEGTAGVCRAAIEHNLLYDGGKRLYYAGPMFRHERPQRGRYRQFHQIGAEALGFGGAEVDAEIILLAHSLWQKIGLQGVELQLNCLGQPEERRAHRAALIAYFEQHTDQLDEDAKRRLYANPLRILDTKNPAMQALVENAPKLTEHLGAASLAHFQTVQDILQAHGVAYSLNPRLVRGLDYYNLTVFEFVTTALGSQGTICGGGRYDYLMEMLGGKPAPAIGWAMGVERVLELIKEQGIALPEPAPDCYAVIPDVAALPQAMLCISALRQTGVAVHMHTSSAAADGSASMGSFKSQFKKADSSGARYALIFGADELTKGEVSVKPLRLGLALAEQRNFALADAAAWAENLGS